MVADRNFWRGRQVFLTGHTGFKGAWMALWLQELGAKVHGYALAPPTTPSLFDLATVHDGMASGYGDIRDLTHLTKMLDKAAPEVVFHFAAQSLVRESYKSPVETFATNLLGTVNLLEAIRKTSSVKAVVVITTDKCYENREWVWGYRENEPMGGYDPYSASKGCAEIAIAAYRNSFFNAATTSTFISSARAGNVIGGGDWATDRLVPDIIRALLAGKPVQIRNPNAIRPWQHVLEPLSGYLMLAERLCVEGAPFAEGWNFGPADEDAKPVGWIARRVCEEWGNGASFEIDKGEHPHEAHYLKLDCSKARMKLGWTPKLHLDEALKLIIEWTKAYAGGENLRNATVRQIQAYEELRGGAD